MSIHSIKRKHDYICMDISEKIGIILFSKLPLGNKLQRRRRKKSQRTSKIMCATLFYPIRISYWYHCCFES